jgi:translation initiation factor IF-1
VLPGAMFCVDFAGRRNVLAYISGKIRKYFIHIVPGDKVEDESHQSTVRYSERACSDFAPAF